MAEIDTVSEITYEAWQKALETFGGSAPEAAHVFLVSSVTHALRSGVSAKDMQLDLRRLAEKIEDA